MDDFHRKKLTRRSLLKSAAFLASAVVAAPLLTTRPAEAGDKVPKSAMQYRNHPNAGHECSTCIQFIPGKSAAANGTCKVVAGSISPHGWCVAYSPKS
ncbi:MAG: hypothetical protein B7Z66_07595 [Chromatiales bacterium 21-64-14]|nr:MAG: hypothetical protein B7Z66_07595 [Chromatiales bacterium 21-64-14]HQU15404.1 high-potential iron-sulfur protein [Gammaproteobacteria bacterium]